MESGNATRCALYEDLLLRSEQGLDSTSVDKFRTHFKLHNGVWIPTTTSPAASFVCAAIPEGHINEIHSIALDIKRILDHDRPDPSSSCAYWVQPQDLHLTIFQTSHHSEPVPDIKNRRAQVVSFLEACVRKLPLGIRLCPERILIASSGSVLLLYNAPDEDFNEGIEWIRIEAAKRMGEWLPKTQTRTIWHSTLGRILEDRSADSLCQARRYCDVQSPILKDKIGEMEIKKLWYVEEEVLYSMKGSRAEIALKVQPEAMGYSAKPILPCNTKCEFSGDVLGPRTSLLPISNDHVDWEVSFYFGEDIFDFGQVP